MNNQIIWKRSMEIVISQMQMIAIMEPNGTCQSQVIKSPLFGFFFIFVVQIERLFINWCEADFHIQKQVLMAKNAMRLMNLIREMPTLQIYPASNVTLI